MGKGSVFGWDAMTVSLPSVSPPKKEKMATEVPPHQQPGRPLTVIRNVALGMGDACCYCWVYHSIAAAGRPIKIQMDRCPEIFDMFGVPPSGRTTELVWQHADPKMWPPKGELSTGKGWIRSWLDGFGHHGVPIVRPPYVERPEDGEWAEKFWNDRRGETGGRPKVLIFPQVAHAVRGWPWGHFEKLSRMLGECGYTVASSLAPYIQGHNHWYAFTDNIYRVTALMKRADLVIGNESGPAHLAATVGTRTLVLAGPTRKDMFHDHLPESEFLHADLSEWSCVGCHWDGKKGYKSTCHTQGCGALWSVSPARVYRRVREILPVAPMVRVGKWGESTGIGPRFQEKLRELGPFRCAVETGTYDGRGSTTALAGCCGEVHTVELDPQTWETAKRNLEKFPHVTCYLGLSILKKDVPTREQLEEDQKLGPFGCSPAFYSEEGMSNPSPREGILLDLVREKDPDLVLLDSAGGMGWREFLAVLPLLKTGVTLALDDARSEKHRRTMQRLRELPEWTLVWSDLQERYGSAIWRKTS